MIDDVESKSKSIVVLPVLALDVDGPLALMGSHVSKDVFEKVVDYVPITISRHLPGRLVQLARHFQIVWSSAWGKRASYKIAPLVGLPKGLPYVRFESYPEVGPGESYKLPGLKGWLKNYAAAIVDDEIGEDMRIWASARPCTLLIEVDPRYGLLDDHVRQLIEFSERVRGLSGP